MTHLRQGGQWKKIADKFKHRCKQANLPCHICHQPINYQARRTPDSFEVDHLYPISIRPDLVYDETWFRPSHARCNNQRGNNPPDRRDWVAANW
jgi:hypothetical protein